MKLFRKKFPPKNNLSDLDETPQNVKKSRNKRRSKKFQSVRECWGFCGFLKTSWILFKEFSADTSIHGIKYLTDKRLHWGEKLFWVIALSLSITACSYLIHDSYRKWQEAPVIVSFSERFINIWEIPFAAVTICPIGGIDPLNKNFTLNESLPGESPLKNFSRHVDIDFRITRVKWRDQQFKSSLYFTQIVTEEGFCYTFNMLNFNDLFKEGVVSEAYENLKNETNIPRSTKWSLEGGYSSRETDLHPQRAAGAGDIAGLSFQIWRKIAEVKAAESFQKGFKLVLHLPNEVPRFDKQFWRFPLEKSASLIVRPTYIETDEQLRGYDIHVRKCYFAGEKELKYFKIYTRTNCQTECAANYTLELCNCIHHSSPRLKDENVCDYNQIGCYKNATRSIMINSMTNSLKQKDKRGKIACDCLPSCTSLRYEGEISYDEFRYFGKYKNNIAFRSAAAIFFKDDDFLYSKRSELHSFTDFIANFGGILGLFLGVSILSIVEIIYFMAFRSIEDKKPERKSESPHENQPNISTISDIVDASFE